MKKYLKQAITVFSFLLILAPAVVCLATTKDDLDNAKKREQELEQRLKSVKSNIAELKKDMQSMEEYIAQLDEQMLAISDDITVINGKIDVKNGEIAVTTENLNQAQNAEQEQYEAMKLRIKYMYENNTDTYFDMILSSGSLSELLNQAEYVSKISKYDREKLDEFVATKDFIAANKAQLEREEAELESYKSDLEDEQKVVEVLLEAKQDEMQKLENDKKAYEAKQKDLEKDMQALDSLISQLTAQYNAEQLKNANAVATQQALFAKKLLLWPCPSSHLITSRFSPNRLDPLTGSYYAAHKGTDIGASTGTPVIAAAAGLVTAAGFSASMGNYVVISHGDGITTRYYHNSRLAVSAGQAVTAGQVISYVGSTGWSTGPHLHFEVRINDVPYDAEQFY